MNVPNSLTLLRIALIPIFIVIFYLPFEWKNFVTAGLFGIAALTDWLDGYLARRLKQSSAFGAFLDPVADKLMVTVVLVLLVQDHPTPWLAVPSAIIIGREIAVSALREWMAGLGQRSSVRVVTVAKFKTTAQMIALVLLLYGSPLEPDIVYKLGFVLLYVSAALTLWSMFVYLRAAGSSMRSDAG